MAVELFVFAGRRANMVLQLRWARAVLARYPDVQYVIWNLARNRDDGEWLQTVDGDRITVRNDFADVKPTGWGMHQVWETYANLRDSSMVLVKVDDDVVFLDAHRFGDLVTAVRQHPGVIVSADVINNGACDAHRIGCDPLETFIDADWADKAHTWFFDHWRDAVTAPITCRPQQGWVSINAIGLTPVTVQKMLRHVGRKCSPVIAGHTHGRKRAGDEGAANMLPRVVLSGVMAAHLTFGPQQVPNDQQDCWRKQYIDIADRHFVKNQTMP